MDVEEALREYLEREGARAGAPPEFSPKIRRRVSMRRVLTATTLALVVVAASVGAFVALKALIPASALRPAAPEPSLTPVPQPRDGVRVHGPSIVVARGTIDGIEWSLVAYRSTLGLCTDLYLGQGAGGGCGFGVPGQHDLSVSRSSLQPLERDIIDGVISKKVSSVEWRPADGTPMPIRIIRESAGFGVNFFVAFVPPGARGTVVATDADGNVLETQAVKAFPQAEPTCCNEAVIDEHNILVYYPFAWERARQTLAPGLENRVEIFSVGTLTLEPGAEECAEIPERALEAVGPADAFITIQEDVSPQDYQPRPRHFSPSDGVVPDSVECLKNRAELFFKQFAFYAEGRSFLAYVAIGEQASEATREEVWDILDSLASCDPSSKPGDCL